MDKEAVIQELHLPKVTEYLCAVRLLLGDKSAIFACFTRVDAVQSNRNPHDIAKIISR